MNTPQIVMIDKTDLDFLKNAIAAVLNKVDSLTIEKILTPNEYISAEKACKIYSFSRSFFEKCKRDGTISVYKLKGKVFVKPTEIEKLFKNGQL